MQLEKGAWQSELADFLRGLRARIDPGSSRLGPYERLSSRYGRRVTQEEIAEATGVTRGWYRLLESGAGVRASMQLLDRLAAVLAMTVEERATLFTLALPELRDIQISNDSLASLQAFSHVRLTAERLWTTTSETEAYLVVSERLAEWFDDAVLIHWMRRRADGWWERHCALNRGADSYPEILEEINASLGPTGIDDLMLYPNLSQPGAVGGSNVLLPTAQQARVKAYARRSLTPPEFIHARVHSRSGLIGGFSVMHEAGRSYSQIEYAVIGALAELVSLTLS